MDDKEIKRILDDALAFGEALEKCRIDHNKPLKPREYLFSWKGVKFGERGTIMNVRGEPKIGKSFLVSAFCQAFLNGKKEGLKGYAGEEEKIAFIDAYHSDGVTRGFVRRMSNTCSRVGGRMEFFNVEYKPIDETLEFIKGYLKYYKPSMLVIYGIEGLVPIGHINDRYKISCDLRWLIDLAEEYNVLIITTSFYYGEGHPYEKLGENLTDYLSRISHDEITITRHKTKNEYRWLLHENEEIFAKKIRFSITNDNGIGKITLSR